MIDGNASFENWWKDHKVKNIAFRPADDFLKSLFRCDRSGHPGAEQSKLEHPSIFFRSLAFLGYVCDQPKSISEYGWLGPGVLS